MPGRRTHHRVVRRLSPVAEVAVSQNPSFQFLAIGGAVRTRFRCARFVAAEGLAGNFVGALFAYGIA